MSENEVKIEEKFIEQAKLIARGAEIIPNGVMELAKRLQEAEKNNKPLRVKLGLDPTRPDLHLGHTVVMRKLKLFQQFGHKVVLIVGGATAMIGDPSGKSQTRPSLTKEEVESNAKTYFEQMDKVVNIKEAEVTNNANWLHKMGLVDLLKLASNVTVAKLMTRDDFQKRYQSGQPIAVHEFFYPLMQAYDSVVVDADIELGGTDQMFNLLLGREVQLAYGKENPQLVFLLPLLEGTDGVLKMSKTYPQNCISLTEEPKNMYGKLMSIKDEMIMRYYTLLTDKTDNELKEIEQRLKNGETPRNIKMELAYYITKEYCGENSANSAQEDFINVVQNHQTPEDIDEINGINKNILDILVEKNFAKSKSDAKRLIQQGAVKFDDEKIDDINFVVTKSGIIKSGKRNYVKVV